MFFSTFRHYHKLGKAELAAESLTANERAVLSYLMEKNPSPGITGQLLLETTYGLKQKGLVGNKGDRVYVTEKGRYAQYVIENMNK